LWKVIKRYFIAKIIDISVGDNTHKDEQQRTLRKNGENYELKIEENELRKKCYHNFINNNDTYI
jgi:hypothetical protein